MAGGKKNTNPRSDLQKERLKKYFFVGVLAVIIFLSYLIMRDFIIVILSAFVLAYLIRPVDLFIAKKIPRKVSALLSILLVLVVLIIIIYFSVGSLIFQAGEFATEENVDVLIEAASQVKYFDLIEKQVNLFLPWVGNFVAGLFGTFLTSIFPLLFKIFIAFFISFYLLVDWERLVAKGKKLLPFKKKDHIFANFAATSKNIIFGTFLVSIIEFVLAFVAFYFLNVPFAVLLAFFISILAFIPLIGPALILVPMFLIYLIQGDYFRFSFVLIMWILLSYFVDSFLRIYILGKTSKIHPVVLLLGVIGGVQVFGLFGFVLGPLILGLFIDILEEGSGSR